MIIINTLAIFKNKSQPAFSNLQPKKILSVFFSSQDYPQQAFELTVVELSGATSFIPFCISTPYFIFHAFKKGKKKIPMFLITHAGSLG